MEIAIGLAGLIITWITLQKTVFAEPKEQKQTLLAHFGATQTLSKDVSDRIFRLAEATNGWENEAMPGFTYRTFYNGLLESQKTNLSEDIYTNIEKMKMTKSAIRLMQGSLNDQFGSLLQIQTSLKLIESNLNIK